VASSSATALPVAIAELALAAALPVATVWLILHIGQVAERVVVLGRRWRLLPREKPRTYERPVELLAADLRRLGTAIRTMPYGTTQTRRKALLLAYDDTLIAACRALDLPQALGELPLGVDRELERLRVEVSLESAGLRFRPVPH